MPDVNPVNEAFWAAATDGRLLLSECGDCGLVFHYPRPVCPDCSGADVDWLEADGTGEVYTFSVARSLSGWPEEALPEVVAYVELDEGPRVLTNLDADPEDLAIGDRVEVAFVETERDDVAIPVFEPVV